MKDLSQFEIAGGSVLGTRHVKMGRNNQDSFVWIQKPEYIIAVVADGCSSGLHSEVGSKIISHLFVQSLAKYISRPHPTITDENLFRHDWLWYNVRQDVLSRIRILAQDMDENLINTICQYFLATIVGCIITPESTCIFGCGDGIFYLNGNIQRLGPFPGNKPPYLCYGITGSEVTNNNPSLLDIQRHIICPTEQVETLLIGTDGVDDLTKIADTHLPGREEKIGDISQFWREDIYFRNPEWIRNVLTTINTEKRKPIWEEQTIIKHQGVLPDDTTLIVLRNKIIYLGKPCISMDKHSDLPKKLVPDKKP